MYSVFEFIHIMIDSSKFRSTVKKTIDQILYYVITYMQITEDQVVLYSNYVINKYLYIYEPLHVKFNNLGF